MIKTLWKTYGIQVAHLGIFNKGLIIQKKILSTQAPLVSIIMNCHNCSEFVVDAIDSVYKQTFSNWEIILWDNCSDDNLSNLISNYDERLRYLKSKTFTTLGRARELALRKTRGRFIAFLDSDDLFIETKLESQVNLLNSDETVGMVFSDCMFFDENGDKYSNFSLVTPYSGEITNKLINKDFIATSSILIRKSLLDEINFKFNEKFSVIMDYDLHIRASIKTKVAFTREILSKWRIHNNNGSKDLHFVLYHEAEEMLNKIIADYPFLKKECSQEIKYRIALNNLNFGIESWSKGDKILAKKYLRKSNFNLKTLLIYLMISTINYSVFLKIKMFAFFTRSFIFKLKTLFK